MQIVLLKPHAHAGIVHAPGAQLILDDDLAQWLVDSGIASAVPASTQDNTLIQKPLSRSEEKTK